MQTSKPKTGKVYRCASNAKSGSGSCGYYEVKEEVVLPGLTVGLGMEAGGTVGHVGLERDLRFRGRTKDQRSRSRRDAETQFLKPVQQRRNPVDKAQPLRVEQNAERAGETDSQRLRDPASCLVIDDRNGVRPLDGQHQDFGLARPKITDQSFGRHGGRFADVDPTESIRQRNVVARFLTDGEFLDHGRRHNDAVRQSGQQVQMTQLVKVLKRRRVADQFTRGGFPSPVALRSD